MTEMTENDNEHLKKSYESAIHEMRFSKDNKNPLEVVEIERKCIAAKYMNALVFKFICIEKFDRYSDSEETATILLRDGLEKYSKLVDNRDGVNNYWQQFKAQKLNIKNDPLEWTSRFSNTTEALQYVKPLPCQSSNVEACKGKNFFDRHVENIVYMWKTDRKSPKARKVAKSIDYINNDTSNQRFSNPKSTVAPPSISICKIHSDEPVESNNKLSYPTIKQSTNFLYEKSIFQQGKPNQCNASNYVNLQPRRDFENKDKKDTPRNGSSFVTALDEFNIQQVKNKRQGLQKKTLGGKSSVNSQYVCPFKRDNERNQEQYNNVTDNSNEVEDERLKNIDPKMVELIKNEIMDSGTVISWNDIAGLEYAKKIIQEIVVFPMLRPDIFTGLRQPPKGILLFGPPGTGKTLIGKCIASQSKSTFFSISASSLTSKWIGEGEKMVRALFAVARVYQPSVVFIDEIDSLLTQRSETEHESSRRIKTEFLVQLDGAATSEADRILIVGATNRPYELDEAARRRLVKRLYIPLPEREARSQIVKNLLKSERHNLSLEDIDKISELTEGYSGADMTNLCKEASMGPIRSIPFSQLENISKEQVRKVTMEDFKQAITCVRPSVSGSDLTVYLDWDKTYGTGYTQINT